MKLLPNEPSGNWMPAYAHILERTKFGRECDAVTAALRDCLASGYDRDCVEYARDMAAVQNGVWTFDEVVKRRAASIQNGDIS